MQCNNSKLDLLTKGTFMRKGYRDILIIIGVLFSCIFFIPGIGLIIPFYHGDEIFSWLIFLTTWVVSKDLISFTDNHMKRAKGIK